MRHSLRTFILSILTIAIVLCYSPPSRAGDRPPAVAGQFYPAQKDELSRTLSRLFARGVPSKGLRHLLAIISPHAGYVYSGEVAASGYNQLDPNTEYENVFVLGPSHHVGFEGAAVYVTGDYRTPLGSVRVNKELGKQLIGQSGLFTGREDAHRFEHSVEVQLPFLQHKLKHEFLLVPIVIGSDEPGTLKKIADVLRPFMTAKNLFVISTDFSHYPAYTDAITADKLLADAIVANSPDSLLQATRVNNGRRIPGLVTSACGSACLLTLLYMTQQNHALEIDIVQYKNSGDADVGDKSRVVGYYAIAVAQKESGGAPQFSLKREEKEMLLRLARATLQERVVHRQVPNVDPRTLSVNVKQNCGAFVTLKIHGELRGCIGRFNASEPLHTIVQQMTVAAATEDQRFTPVEPGEVKEIEIEISVLTPMRKVTTIDEIRLGKHGIYVTKGGRGGTFLPQVATETGWTKEEFLGHCSRDKAGIGWNGWKDADIYIYEALVFSERDR